MDANLKATWVEALRSGKYEQADGYLEKDNCFCCLGVLMQIQGCSPRKLYPKIESRVTSKLPEHLRAGLSSFEMEDLANRNDGSVSYFKNRHSFAQLADYIEKNL